MLRATSEGFDQLILCGVLAFTSDDENALIEFGCLITRKDFDGFDIGELFPDALHRKLASPAASPIDEHFAVSRVED